MGLENSFWPVGSPFQLFSGQFVTIESLLTSECGLESQICTGWYWYEVIGAQHQYPPEVKIWYI